jgi:transcriptional regulator with XRE-family HTH domain
MGAYFTLESSSTSKRLTFGDLQYRLIQTLKRKLDNGEFTERGLARLSGISQPQVHNLLKGARRLSPESADILLGAIKLSVLDLLSEADLSARGLVCNAPNFPHTPTPAPPTQQLPLVLEPERCPRKNPALARPRHLGVTEQAS